VKSHAGPSPAAGAPVLVTGGAGFIGSHLVEALVARGARVTVVDNLATGDAANLRAVFGQVRLLAGDLGELLRAGALMVGEYAQVFHLAANPYIPPSVDDPAYDFRENLGNTFALLEAMRRSTSPPRLVNASSAAVYGNPARLPMSEGDPTLPISPYGVSKLAAERYVEVFARLYGLQATSLRLFSVFGPRQRKQVVFDLFRKLEERPSRLEVLGDGTQARDFTYVGDVVAAMMLVAAAAPGKGEVYNVASGTTTTISGLVAACCALWDAHPEIAYTGNVRPGDAERWDVDMTRLRALGFAPQVSLAAGLRAIQAWDRGRG
jgi:UDP-glucose 4-epimerase